MNKKKEKDRSLRSQLSRQVIQQYLLTVCAGVILLAVFVAISWQAAHSVVWQGWDPRYQLLHWVKENLLLVCSFILLAAGLITACLFIARSLRFLDEIVAASKQLASPDDREIRLPRELKGIQDEMNLARQQALRNAALAQQAEQRKNDLIVYLAHDLKTPLTSVIGYLTLLQEAPELPADLRARYTGIALDKAQRLEELINEFFDITRFNFTSLVLETEHVSLSRMLEQITWEFRPILAEKQLEWQLDLEPGVEMVCDPGKLERVFDNLIRNAVNYSYPGTAICLEMHSRGEMAEIQLTNRGRTIPPEKLEHIFEQFYRVDSSRGSRTGGAGLGLAIAREIVERHGGTISAASQEETIRFAVQLPLDLHKIVRNS